MVEVPTTSLIRHEIERVLIREAGSERLRGLLEKPGSFDDLLWAQAVEQGWPALAFSEAQGGLGLGWVGLSEIAEALGRVTASLPVIAGFCIGDCLASASNATEFEQHIASLVEGRSIAALVLGESGEAGLERPSTLKYKEGKLTGTKAAAAFASTANFALVSACHAGATALCLVDLSQTRVIRSIVPALDNARAVASLQFNDAAAIEVRFPQGAAAALRSILSRAATMTAFEQLGGASACLEMSCRYALERKAFGGPIGRFQAIKHKLADMYSAIEIARGCAIDALQELDAGNVSIAMAAAARLSATRAYDLVARETIQVHGGIGVTWEAVPQQHYRRARSLALELGSWPMWRDLLVDQLAAEVTGAKS